MATPLPFPNVGGFCGLITFPAGSSPVSGNTLTLQTAITLPAAYPTSIPPGAGNYGVGATPVAPWLTYSLSQTLHTPPGAPVGVQFVFPQPPPFAFYYIAIYDLTANPNQPFATFPFMSSPAARPRGATRTRGYVLSASARTKVRPFDVTGGDQYYFGLFSQPNGSNITSKTVTVNTAGSKFYIPTADGYSGVFAYGKNDAAAGSQATLVSANVDPSGGSVPPLGTQGQCPASPTGTPVFYEQFTLATLSPQVTFQTTNAASTLSSSSFVSGAAYEMCWYDITNAASTGTVFLAYAPITAKNGSVSFPTLFSGGYIMPAQEIIISELVKD